MSLKDHRATGKDKVMGWDIDPDFIQKVHVAAMNSNKIRWDCVRLTYEDIEAVILGLIALEGEI